MKIPFPLWLKIALFSATIVAAAGAGIWVWAIWNPSIREWNSRETEYRDLQRTLGASSIVPAFLKDKRIHGDIAYVIRSREGQVLQDDSVVHVDRLDPIDPVLSASYRAEPMRALRELKPLGSGDRPGLVVKRVRLETPGGAEDVTLGFSKASLDRQFREKLVTSGVVMGIALLGAILGGVLLARTVASPVRQLASAMEGIGRGSFEPVQVRSRDEVGLLARSFNDMVTGLKERERLKGTLARYVSDDIAERILTERSDLDVQGELREVTVLFLDIRGFTSLSERLPPREIVGMLNEYFELIIEAIFKHHGTLNKFIGDAVMALYGAPRTIDDPAMRAVQTAIEIERVVAMHNTRRREVGKEVITVGIGINTGFVIAGNIGSERRMEYTVIGDEVNLAQRLESAAREGEILVSQATYERVKDRVQVIARQPVALKGKSVPVRVYEVTGLLG